MSWALAMLADGLATRVITQTPGQGVSWHRGGQDKPVILGNTLATALYRLGEFHRLLNVQAQLEKDLRAAHQGVTPQVELTRREELLGRIGKRLTEMELRQSDGRMTQEDALDGPILEALRQELQRQVDGLPNAAASEDSFDHFDADAL